MSQQDLVQVLSRLDIERNIFHDPALLVGAGTFDDASVYRITEDIAIVSTIDFFTPMLDDPYSFGQVAAANSLSDVYAMGATPLTALNVAAFPIRSLDPDLLSEILKGGLDKAAEAGVSISGGHTIDDPEPKYGLAVIGKVHPARIIRNCTPAASDSLVLTKPLGSGIYTTAIKHGALGSEGISLVTGLMSRLNRAAAEAMIETGVSAATDVTGYGLIGHLSEMLGGRNPALTAGPEASRTFKKKAGARIFASRVKLLPEVLKLAAEGIVPGGTRNNLKYASGFIERGNGVSEEMLLALCDAQTSGGLLISTPPGSVDRLVKGLEAGGVTEYAIIGQVIDDEAGKIYIEF